MLDALRTWLCVPVLSPLRPTGLHPARCLHSRQCSLWYRARGREAEKFTDVHLNKIFLSEFPMRCQQLFNIMLPLLADHVVTQAGGESAASCLQEKEGSNLSSCLEDLRWLILEHHSF